MENFCGSEFWNSSLTWQAPSQPDLTPCFEKTVLIWIPCLFLWILSPVEAYFLYKSRDRDVPVSFVNVAKLIVSSILVTLQFIVMIYTVAFKERSDTFGADYAAPGLLILSFLLQIVMIILEKRRGFQTSPYLFIFWLLMTLCAMPAFRTHLLSFKNGTEAAISVPFVSEMLQYPVVVVMFVLNFLKDKRPQKLFHPRGENSWPEEDASFPSRLLFSWFSALVWRGYKKTLTKDMLWDLPYYISSHKITEDFDKFCFRGDSRRYSARDDEYEPLNRETVSVARDQKKKPISILPVLVRIYGGEYLFASFIQLCADMFKFVSPFMTSVLISFVKDLSQPAWRGYFYVFMFWGITQLNTILRNIYFDGLFNIGVKIRTAVMSAVYRKALKVTNSSRKDSSVGEVVNLMAIDAQQFLYLTPYINMIWSSPLQIVITLYYLWRILGVSAFAGVAVLVAMIPVSSYAASRQKKLQEGQMKKKDLRVKLLNEILNGIRVLKLYAWEPPFEDQVMAIRKDEMKGLTRIAQLEAINGFIWSCTPVMVSLATFVVYVTVSTVPLDAEKAFVSITLLNMLRMPFAMLPTLIATTVQAGVSVKRINKFLNTDEVDDGAVSRESFKDTPILIKNGSFAWDRHAKEKTVLRDMNLKVQRGSLVAIVGTVGAGKSSLCTAILGEMEKTSGWANVDGSVAYVPQQAWIRNATLENNILFGSDKDDGFYSKIIDSCALGADLDMLPAKDQTEIGEKGINLSGGQKQRISLARAVYFDADIYVMDDPLSAVDSHVGKHIFDHVIGPQGLLQERTRLLVTHGLTYLRHVDHIVVMKDGMISEQGTYNELIANKGEFQEFLLQHLPESETEESEELEEIKSELEKNLGRDLLQRQISLKSKESDISVDGRKTSLSEDEKRRHSIKEKIFTNAEKTTGDNLIEVEKTETGRIAFSIYLYYIISIGIAATFFTLLFNFANQAFSMGSNVLLSKWSDDDNATRVDVRDNYIELYGSLGALQAVTSLCAEFLGRTKMLSGSAIIYRRLLANVMRQPQRFFDTNPTGRILSRFSKDTDTIDVNLPMAISDLIFCLMEVMTTLAVIIYATPIVVAALLPVILIYYFIQVIYVTTSRQLRRIESVSRSPIYSHFGETLQGVTSIRSYRKEEEFFLEAQHRVDQNVMSYYPIIKANRWLSIRLESISNLITFFAALFAVLSRGTITGGAVGLSISYALSVTLEFNYLIRMVSDVETNAVAVERVKEYTETPQEQAWELENQKPPPDWPQEGKVTFENYSTRYREGLDLAIKDITFEIKPTEKVGIVGRTGAGKSSLTLALFRIIEAAGGIIIIDDINIASIGLHDLRRRLTIIPQDPVLFSGTLRINLDPFSQYSDQTIWNALEHSHLKDFVAGLEMKLDYQITEGGENLSVGQRQLVCLARALLRKTKILVLDEATAAVDFETDSLIQDTIRREFAENTVLTIAHRLNTIMDYTRVIVMDKGSIAEFDTPENLLKNPHSLFYAMARDAGLT